MKKIKREFVELLKASRRNSETADHARAKMETHLRYEREALTSISDRIAAGESSGDAITDFVFRHQWVASLEMVERYHTLNDAIASHQGQLVLVIERTEVDTRIHPHLERRPQDLRLKTRCAIGIIRGAELLLDVERGVSSIPTGDHFTFSGDPDWHFADVVIEEGRVVALNLGNIQARGAGRDLGSSLGKPLQIENPATREFFDGQTCYAIEAHFGDDEVAGWFRTNGKGELLEQVSTYLDHPIPAPATQPIQATQ